MTWDPTSPNLAETISTRITPSAGDFIRHRFNELGLQMPKQNEWTEGSAGSYLIPIARPDLFIRISPAHGADHDLPELERLNHPAILQPLGQFKHRDILIEICPGITPGVSPEHLQQLKQWLENDNLHFTDPSVHNCGYLPNGMPVILDRGAVNSLTYLSRCDGLSNNELFPIEPAEQEQRWRKNAPNGRGFVQQELYGSFARIFESGNLSAFMQACLHLPKRYTGASIALEPSMRGKTESIAVIYSGR